MDGGIERFLALFVEAHALVSSDVKVLRVVATSVLEDAKVLLLFVLGPWVIVNVNARLLEVNASQARCRVMLSDLLM